MNIEVTKWRVRYYLRLFDRIGLKGLAEEWLPSWEDPDNWTGSNGWGIATMPADGWKRLSILLVDDVLGPRGGKREKARPMHVSAMQEVQTAVNRRARHPAIDRHGVFGTMPEVITAWRDPASGQFWPFHFDAPQLHEFVVLVPRYEQGITTWSPGDVPAGMDARLGQPVEHLRFTLVTDQS